MGLEILAEANAQRGIPVTSLSNLRAHQWLALDQGHLDIETESTADRTSIYSLRDGVRALAFEGHVDNMPTGEAAPDRGHLTTAPKRWTAASFYRDYAFHGPAFQGIEEVVSVSGNQISARLRVTHLPALNHADLTLDPALLDCAGQLAAFWLLEQGADRAAAFPFAAQKLRIFAPPPAPGSAVLCRGVVQHTAFGTLLSHFDFLTESGAVLYRLSGFEQRIIQIPASLWNLLFGGAEITAATIAAIGAEPLARHSGIWGRALAHLVLDREQLRHFYEQNTTAEARAEWLAQRLSARSHPLPADF